MSPGASWTLPATSPEAIRDIYFYSGNSIQIDNQLISVNSVISVSPEAAIEIKNGDEKSKVLILEGKPIAEPVAQHGPFVMNTRAEIMEAFEEYQRTQFGGWPWEAHEKLHDSEKGRFALYADGTEETR
jgi:redox-sensitive bicupin YhaK (pirin superfamily)